MESATCDARLDVSRDSLGVCASTVATPNAITRKRLNDVAFTRGFRFSGEVPTRAFDYCRDSLVDASDTPHAGLTPPWMMRKLSSGSDARLTVRTIGTGEKAPFEAASAPLLRKSLTPSVATAERAHTSTADCRPDGLASGESSRARQRGNESGRLVVVGELHDMKFPGRRIRCHRVSVLIREDLGESDAGVLVVACLVKVVGVSAVER